MPNPKESKSPEGFELYSPAERRQNLISEAGTFIKLTAGGEGKDPREMLAASRAAEGLARGNASAALDLLKVLRLGATQAGEPTDEIDSLIERLGKLGK